MFMLIAFALQATPPVVKVYESDFDKLKRQTRELREAIDRENARIRREGGRTPTTSGTETLKTDTAPFDVAASNGWSIVPSPSETSCEMRSVFDGGTYLSIAFDPSDEGYFVRIGNPKWKSLVPDKSYTVRYELAGNVWQDDDALLDQKDPLKPSLQSGFEKGFGVDLRKAAHVKIKYQDVVLGVLSLRGTSKAIPEMIKCATEMYRKSDVDPFAE